MYAQQPCAQDQRTGGITADADDQIRFETLEDQNRLQNPFGDFGNGQNLPCQSETLDSFGCNFGMLIARFRQNRDFKGFACADKQNLVVLIPRHKLLGDGNTREKMAAGSAAGNDNAQSQRSFGIVFFVG